MPNPKLVCTLVLILAVGASAQSTPTATLTASDATTNPGALGQSVAMSGSVVVAGAPNAAVKGNVSQGIVYVFTKPAAAPWTDMTESARLIVPSGNSNSGLGASVAVSGDGSVIVAGAPGPTAQAVCVFVRPSGGWQGTIGPTASLQPGVPPKVWIVTGNPGRAVAINSKGDTIIAGAYDAGTQSHDSGGKTVAGVPQQGAAYVWVEPSGGWINANGTPQTAKLTASDGVAYDQFGYAVGASANTVVAGAPAFLTNSSTGKGSAYLFARPSTGVWHDSSGFSSKFTASDEKKLDGFGSSLAVGDGSALVALGSGAGKAYVFARPSTWWPKTMTQTAELTPSDMSGGDFGFGFAIGSNSVVIGAPADGNGATYTFAKPSTGWVDMSLPASMVGGNGASLFGYSNSVGGRSTVVGAPFSSINGSGSAGAAYVFSN